MGYEKYLQALNNRFANVYVSFNRFIPVDQTYTSANSVELMMSLLIRIFTVCRSVLNFALHLCLHQ